MPNGYPGDVESPTDEFKSQMDWHTSETEGTGYFGLRNKGTSPMPWRMVFNIRITG